MTELFKDLEDFYAVNALSNQERSYKVAASNDLLHEWVRAYTTEDAALKSGLAPARARCQDLQRNNSYAESFVTELKSNVVGYRGIILQAKAINNDGKPDELANDVIEAAWNEWGRRENCSLSQSHSFKALQNIVLERCAIDGDVLCRVDYSADNPFGMSVEIIEGAAIDDTYNVEFKNGKEIVQGIEYDSRKRRTAFYVREDYGRGWGGMFGFFGKKLIRLPAEDCLYISRPRYYSQSRAAPWLVQSAIDLNHLGAAREAELIAWRLGASKMGFFTKTDDATGYTGERDNKGNLISKVKPGQFEILPRGYDVKLFDPAHPNQNVADFSKLILRAVAAGTPVSYNTIARDLEGINYSSIRHGAISERDVYKTLQDWLIESFLDPLYRIWLRTALLKGAVGNDFFSLPFSKYKKFLRVLWRARRWEWVDPEKEISAKIKELSIGATSPQQICYERGGDFYENLDEIEGAIVYAKSKGIEMNFLNPKTTELKVETQNEN